MLLVRPFGAEGTKDSRGPAGCRGPRAPSPPTPAPCGSVIHKPAPQTGTWPPGGASKGVRRRCHFAPVM